MGTRCADHMTPLYPQKLELTSPTGGGRSVGIVRVRTKTMEFCFMKMLTGVSAPDSRTVYTTVLQNNELCAQQYQIYWNYKITAVPL